MIRPFARTFSGLPRRTVRCTALALLLAGCANDATTEPRFDATSTRATSVTSVPALIEEPFQLATPTYDGSGEAVHPDVLSLPGGWRGQRYWVAMTPYAKSSTKLENPSVLVSDDGITLHVPSGVANPIVQKPGRAPDYNSDPELVYEPSTDRLIMFYRLVEKRTNTIRVVSSMDGRRWRQERNAFWVHGHAAVSPTVTAARGATPAMLWYVDAGHGGCHASSTRVLMRSAIDSMQRVAGVQWSEPQVTDLAQPGYVIWHMKVRYVPTKGEYWAVYSAFPQNAVGCDVDDLFFARSTDGVHWQTFAEPLLRHEDRSWSSAAVYRSTFLYYPESDELRLWVSARSVEGTWSLGMARFRYARTLEELQHQSLYGPRLASATTLRGITPLGEAP
jgi:hypothetical protein